MTGLTVRHLGHDGEYYYYTGTTATGTPEYTVDVTAARFMNNRQATLAAQAVVADGHEPIIDTTTI